MKKTCIIKLNSFPVQTTLKTLLKDRTTQKNIIWATNSYEELGQQYKCNKQITVDSLSELDSSTIQPRITKKISEKQKRTKKYAEVFTPSWVCNQMINLIDDAWFDYKGAINTETNNDWKTSSEKVKFPIDNKTWKDYVELNRLEVTCGEAPYLVSRYDSSTGIPIDIKNRIGMLDRKLRIINENTDNENEWYKWVIKAFQSIYGYEYQGDNLLIARINILMTFVDYLEKKWHRNPTKQELEQIANIISWNIWQMDGLTSRVPLSKVEENYQYSFFDKNREENVIINSKCKIYNWKEKETIIYESLKRN